MNKKSTTTVVLSAASLGLLLSALPASAATTWNMNLGTSCGAGTTSIGNSNNCTSTATGFNFKPTSNLKAWSTTGDGTPTPSTTGTMFASANLAYHGSSSGFGVKNGLTGDASPPEHSTDNVGQTDLISLDFSANAGKEVSLKSIQTGWVQTDSDFSLLRWTGVSGPVLATDLKDKTIAGLASTGGWELVAHYAGGTTAGTTAVNSGDLYSSWWLISAYNVNYKTAGTCVGKTNPTDTCTAGNDYFKLLAVAGNVQDRPPSGGSGRIPEPGSFALAGVALLGMVGTRRKLRPQD